jgi:hypothetical protein
MELSTVEVRWFQDGRCPAAVAEWFHRGPRVGGPERRTDEYLLLPDRDDLGVKRRAGMQLDLKLRTATLAGVVLGDGFAGRVEAWTKWSFPLAPESVLPGDRSWVPVEKLRWPRLYSAGSGDTACSVAAGTFPSHGCTVELVEVAIGARHSWGFGFEAFGDGDLSQVLTATCRAFEADTPLGDITFALDDCYGYPAWLMREGAAAD